MTLSKSRFTTGYQCEKLLWWTVHESEAKELQPDKVLKDLFSQGKAVGELARTRFPGGTFIDLPYKDYQGKIAATKKALEANPPVPIFEASFEAGGVFCAVDALVPNDTGWTLIEVKASNKLKDEHIPDCAVQTWVLRQCGLAITRVEVMHLNGEYRHPDQGDLFSREDVTELVEAFLPEVPELVERLQQVLEGPLPEKKVGAHCFEPRVCPFFDRCWDQSPTHIRFLAGVGPVKTVQYLETGITTIEQLDPKKKLGFAAQRQIRALRESRLVVEPTLGQELEQLEEPLGFLDFEAIMRAVPPWIGLAPWGAAVAQFSYHQQAGDEYSHVGWLAEGPKDPRRELAERMIEASRSARRVVVYTSYEKTQIRNLQKLLPDLAADLEELIAKFVDLHKVVSNTVYHPDFRGSFSLKFILNPLVPDLSYEDLVIVDGRVASVEIARLLFVAQKIPLAERERVRHDLLEYCKRDTWATVRLVARLRELAGIP